DQSFFQCQPEQICLPYTAADGVGGTMYEVTIVSGPGTVDAANSRVCFTPVAPGDYTIITRIKDPCDESRDTVVVHVDINSPPVCQLPNDTAIAACDVGTICLPVSATDPDGNLTGCAVTGGPGQIVDGQWCYTPTVSGEVTVTVTCTDACGATCSGSFTVDLDLQGAPPVCNLPRDTTILLCTPMQVCLPYSATDPDGGTVTCTKIAGSGSLVDGHWCYTPPADQEVTATIRCSDDCGNYCEGTFSVLFDINDAPTLTVPEEIRKVICGTAQICVPITAGDQNGNLTSVTVVEGPGSIVAGSWCYTPPAYDQTVNVRIRATDACGLSTQKWMRVIIDYNAVPSCALPPNGYIILCEPGQLCLTFSEVDPASVGVTCTILDGPGVIQGGQWCYNATTRQVVSLTLRCTNPCGDVCTVNRTYTIEIDPNECVPGPTAVQTPIVRVAGDLNNSGTVDVLDLVLLTRQLNRSVTPAVTTPAVTTAAVRRSNTQADVNCDGSVTEADVMYLAAYLFEGGPAPCSNE
ncbi:MAG TPA: dockerin type I domain-containing protein, partial [Acidobacteriota bacterium]|nr:dockerin type I domain-containing protein [Acidobacteriota bacterium]